MCRVYTTNARPQTVFIEGGFRGEMTQNHSVPSCVTSTVGIVPIDNYSDGTLTYQNGQIVARAVKCQLKDDEDTGAVGCRTVHAESCSPFTLEDLKPTIESELDQSVQRWLLGLLNAHQDCFAQSLAELGKSKFGQLKITLKDETPVTYRPYQLSHSEQETVRQQIAELKEHQMIQDWS